MALDADQPGIMGTVTVPVICKMVKFTFSSAKYFTSAATRTLSIKELLDGPTVLALCSFAEALSRPRW
jgi:hypothetical protein